MARKHQATGSAGSHDTNEVSAAPGARARTDRLSPTKQRVDDDRAVAGLASVRHTIEKLGPLADQLADAIAARDYFHARAVASAIESIHRSLVPMLASAARGGADPTALAEIEADARPLSERLRALLALAPATGLVDLDPGADAAREAAWLASLPGAPAVATADGASPLAPRKGDPFAVGRFADAALARAPSVPPLGGTIDPGAASAQPGDGTGLIDEPLIEWQDVKHAALSGPFTSAPRGVQDVLAGPLVSLLRERETIHFLMDPTGSDPIKNGIADVVADLANDPAFTMGFAEGAMTGTVRAVYDTLKGFHDAGKLIQEILVKLATFQHRALLAQGTKAIDDLVKAIKHAPGALEDFVEKWGAADSYTRGAFQGEVIAYIVTQIAIIIAGSLAGPQIAAAGPFSKVMVALTWLDNPIAGITDLARGAKLSSTAIEALRAGGGGVRPLEPLTDARAATSTFDAAGGKPAASPPGASLSTPAGSSSTALPGNVAVISGADAPATLPALHTIEQVTGVEKGPLYENGMAQLRQFYADMETEAQHVKQVRGQAVDGPYGWDYGHDSRRFAHGPVHIVFRVHLEPLSKKVDAAKLTRLKEQVVRGVDEHYNFRPVAAGERIHLEVEFVDDPATAHLRVQVRPGNGRAFLDEWFVDGEPTTHGHEVTHGAFGLPDEYVDPSVPGRAHPADTNVHHDDSLMGNYWHQDGSGNTSVKPGTGLRQRHLDWIRGQLPAPAPASPTGTPPPAPVSYGAHATSGIEGSDAH